MVMSWLRKRWVIFRNPHARIAFGPGSYLGPRFSLHMPQGGTFIAGRRVEFRRGFRAELGAPTATITVGEATSFTYDVLIQCTTSIEIGHHCAFGQSTMLVDGSHRYRDLRQPTIEQGWDFRPLRIADYVAVLTKCTIIADIGERTIIGAHAVVTKSLPGYCVAVGIPARVVDYYGPPGQEPAELSGAAAGEGPVG
jgi:acetyltransferase-like isoleucine patch superfamily enzyme